MAFFQNTRKPEGLGGKLMVTMMNLVMPLCPRLACSISPYRRTPPVWTLAAEGRQRQKAIGSEAPKGT